MTDIIRLILIIFLACFAYKLIYHTSKRLSAIKKIKSLKKLCGASVTVRKNPFISYLKPSREPDVIVEIGDTVYLIRLINGGGSMRFLHFASPEYFVTYSKLRISISTFLRIGGRGKAATAKSTSHRSVKMLPALEKPREYEKKGEYDAHNTVAVLLVTPAPNEVTYVVKNKSSIKAAFTGDEIYGQRLFTASTFVIHADRVKRQEDSDRQAGVYFN